MSTISTARYCRDGDVGSCKPAQYLSMDYMMEPSAGKDIIRLAFKRYTVLVKFPTAAKPVALLCAAERLLHVVAIFQLSSSTAHNMKLMHGAVRSLRMYHRDMFESCQPSVLANAAKRRCSPCRQKCHIKATRHRSLEFSLTNYTAPRVFLLILP